jgi:hypothetical protein
MSCIVLKLKEKHLSNGASAFRLYRFLGYKSICTAQFAKKLVFLGAPCVKKSRMRSGEG